MAEGIGDIGGIIGNIAGSAGNTVQTLMWVLGVGFVVVLAVGLLIFWIWNKKRYNLNVELKKVRSDGRIISGEWCQGLYNAKKGVVFIKRKGIRGNTPMRVFDIRKYLQGDTMITVIQVGTDDLRPVLNDSYTEHMVEYVDEKTGKIEVIKEAIMNIKIDSGLNKAWKSSWENASKRAYSLQSFIQQFQVPITVGIVVVCIFVGFAIVWARLPMICGK